MSQTASADGVLGRTSSARHQPNLRAGAVRFLRAGAWGISDQMLISATNFATMVLLARGLGPAGFGVFSLVYGGMLFANSLQGALIIQPHSVLSAARQGQAYADYTLTSALTQIAFAVAAAGLSVIAALVSWHMAWPVTTLLLALAPCTLAWQFQEYVRRVLYNERRIAEAFLNDLICYGGQTLLVGALWWTESLTGMRALNAITVTSTAAVVLGGWRIRTSLAGHIDRSVFRENWRFGRWLAGAELGYWLSSQAYLYLAGFLLGTAATGVLKAAYVVFGPMRILGFFLKTVFPNHFARTLTAHGRIALNRQVRMAYLLVVPVIGGYCLLAAVFAEPLLQLMYGQKYAGHTSILILYAIFAFVAFMAQIVACALKAGRLTHRVFASQAWASVVALPVGWILVKTLGAEGAVLGMILTSLVVNFSNWRAYRLDLCDADVTQGCAGVKAGGSAPEAITSSESKI